MKTKQTAKRAPRPEINQADRPIFSYNEVRGLLCECCRLRIPETIWPHGFPDGDDERVHHINGQNIVCAAGEWRRNPKAHAKTWPPKAVKVGVTITEF